jgi:hypothetical protein
MPSPLNRLSIRLAVLATALVPGMLPGASLGERLPEETHVAFWVDDLTAARAQAEKSSFYRWLQDPEDGVGEGQAAVARTFQRIPISSVDPLYPVWTILLPRMNEGIQSGLEGSTSVFDFKSVDITNTFTGSVAVYSTMFDLFEEKGEEITEWDVIFAADYKPEEKEKVDEFLKKALARVPEDARKKEVDYFGKTISHIEYYITEEVPLPGEKKKSDADEGLGLAQEIPVIIEYGHVDNVLLLAEGRGEPLKKAVRALKLDGGEGLRLNRTNGFRYASAALGDVPGQLHAYFDIEKHAKELRDIPSQKDQLGLLNALGIDDAGPILATASIDEKGIQVKATVVSENDQRGLLELVSKSPLNTLENTALIPKDAETFGSVSMDFARVFALYRAAVGKLSPGQVGIVNAALAMLKQNSNIDVEKDLLPRCAGEVVNYIRPGSEEYGAGFFFPLTGGTETTNAINTLVRKLNSEETKVLDLEESDFEGQTIWESKEAVVDSGAMPGVYFAATPRGLCLGNTGSELRDQIRRLGGQAPESIRDEPGTAALLGRVPRENLRALVYTPARTLAGDWDRMLKASGEAAAKGGKLPFANRSEFERTIGDSWWTLHTRDRGFLFTFTVEEPKKAN